MTVTDVEDQEKAAVKIQSIQRGKAAREEKEAKEKAAAKIQSIQRGKSVRSQKKNEVTSTDKENDKPESNDNILKDTVDTNFGCDTRKTEFEKAGEDEVRGAETLNGTHIEKFSNFVKKDGYFTGNFPETTDMLLTTPRDVSKLQATQENMLVTTGKKQYKSVHNTYKFFKWFSRKSNGVSNSCYCETDFELFPYPGPHPQS